MIYDYVHRLKSVVELLNDIIDDMIVEHAVPEDFEGYDDLMEVEEDE